jgi:hypothetical protein
MARDYEKEVLDMVAAGLAEELITGYQWGMDLMHPYGEICWMAEQPDSVEMVTAQQFARNLLDEVGK